MYIYTNIYTHKYRYTNIFINTCVSVCVCYILNSESHMLQILDVGTSSMSTGFADRTNVTTVSNLHFDLTQAQLG